MPDGGFLLRLSRAVAYFLATIPIALTQTVLLLLHSRWARHMPMFYHRICCRLFGFQVDAVGQQSDVRPTMYVVNHASYLDIPILGSIIEGSFVAKAEVANWPFFGFLAKLQRTIFIDRRPGSSAKHRDALMQRLVEGDDLIIFPEATSGDSIHMLPFKSTLFSVAEFCPRGVPLQVQPVSVAYVRLDGMPLGRFYRPFLAWYGDMHVMPHLWTMLGLGDVTVKVIFHPPVTLEQFGSRKALAEHCYRVIAQGLTTALAGRAPGDEVAAAEVDDELIVDAVE